MGRAGPARGRGAELGGLEPAATLPETLGPKDPLALFPCAECLEGSRPTLRPQLPHWNPVSPAYSSVGSDGQHISNSKLASRPVRDMFGP